MNKSVTIYHSSDNSKTTETVDVISFCPRCGISLLPETIYGFLVEETDECKNRLYLLNFCAHCEEGFISRHIYDDTDDIYIHDSSAPMCCPNTYFSDNIKKLSSNFVKIFNDSSLAETIGLTSICGMGYRKSLEFLIKDYAISRQPQNTKNISSASLSQCIEQYISDDRLKALAKASAWLGNDETHYTKKHVNYGIHELKAFITALVTFIDAELACQDAETLLLSKAST
ncbi:MAG: DUF4145 domain-containing protein [Eubacterium sp.]|nr:DUF4145 domain-containing protein [Eubacterium sp.]